MKLASPRKWSVSIFVVALVAACADSGDSTLGAGGDDGGGSLDSGNKFDSGGGHDSGNLVGDSGGQDSGGQDSGGGCVSNCTSDTNCQNSCPAVPNGGTNCCDTGSGVCFATSQSTCPSGNDAAPE